MYSEKHISAAKIPYVPAYAYLIDSLGARHTLNPLLGYKMSRIDAFHGTVIVAELLPAGSSRSVPFSGIEESDIFSKRRALLRLIQPTVGGRDAEDQERCYFHVCIVSLCAIAWWEKLLWLMCSSKAKEHPINAQRRHLIFCEMKNKRSVMRGNRLIRLLLFELN